MGNEDSFGAGSGMRDKKKSKGVLAKVCLLNISVYIQSMFSVQVSRSH